LKILCRQEGVTPFMMLLAGFQLILGNYVGNDDVFVGTDVANRNYLKTEGLIGFFINQLVLRTDLSGNQDLRQLIRRVRETTLEAYAHQDLPFDRLVEDLQPNRSLGYTPIFQVLFVVQNIQRQTVKSIIRPYSQDGSRLKYDWVVTMHETTESISGVWRYDANLFEQTTIEKLVGQFQTILGCVADSLDTKLRDLQMMMRAQQISQRNPRPGSIVNVKPRTVALPTGQLVELSVLSSKHSLPAVVRPKIDDFDLIEWVGTEQEFVEETLLRYGAILFRGFKIDGVGEFEKFASTICPELFADYGDLPRERVGKKVYNSTPYPNDRAILFHNESSHLHRWPLKIWFFCDTAPHQGGETPLVDCRNLYRELDPVIRQKFCNKGLLYVRNFDNKLDVNWQDFFKTADRAAVEAFCRQAGMACEWMAGDGLRTKKHCAAVANHPKTGERVFFNQLQAHHVSCLDPAIKDALLNQFGEEGLPRNVYYGDGERIPDSVVDELRRIYEEQAMSFKWEQGDILMVDNMLVAHGRRSFIGPRKIVVAMGEMVTEATRV